MSSASPHWGFCLSFLESLPQSICAYTRLDNTSFCLHSHLKIFFITLLKKKHNLPTCICIYILFFFHFSFRWSSWAPSEDGVNVTPSSSYSGKIFSFIFRFPLLSYHIYNLSANSPPPPSSELLFWSKAPLYILNNPLGLFFSLLTNFLPLYLFSSLKSVNMKLRSCFFSLQNPLIFLGPIKTKS